MAKVSNIFVIPDQGNMTGGDFYDKFGNLTYFADVAALEDKTAVGADLQVSVKAHTKGAFMRDPAPSSVPATTRYVSSNIRQSKGAIPGYTVTFLSNAGAAEEEKRQFQYTGTMSALVAWLKTTAKVDIQLFGPTGTPYNPILAVQQGLV